MAEPVHALAPASPRHPVARKPRIPHPHLAPLAPPAPRVEPDSETTLRAGAPAAHSESWTPAALPMARPAGRPRRRSSRQTPAEKMLRNAVRFGFFVNGAALLIPRLVPTATAWQYGSGDFLLVAAVLLSGQALLLLGRGGGTGDP